MNVDAGFRPVVVIPVYNHPDAIGSTVAQVRAQGFPLLLVDDGSEPRCAGVLRDLAAADPAQVELLRLDPNQGKGAALIAGFRAAFSRGFTHAVQIDADGQHDPRDIARFVAAARAQPEAVICGTPVYDRSVPLGRLIGRYATHVWVWINTLSFAIRDSMCGFRAYPLAATVALFDSEPVGRRMDYDIDVIVRLYWRGVTVVNLPTRVTYPADGISHFDVWRDNLRISRLHALLFFGMLRRAPTLLWRHIGAH